MSTNELREKIVEILEEWGEDKEDRGVASAHGRYVDMSEPREIADRILALLPKMPALRWAGDELFLGNLYVGHVLKDPFAGRSWTGFVGYEETTENSVSPWTSEKGARAAVEKAVREALGIEY